MGCSAIHGCYLILLAAVALVDSGGVWIVEHHHQRQETVTKFDSIDDLLCSVLNKSVPIQSNTSIRFSPGNHLLTLSVNPSLRITDISNLSILVGSPNLTHGFREAKVACHATFGLSFLNVHDLHISGLTFEGCGAPSLLSLGYSQTVNAVIEVNISSDVTLDHVSIQRSLGVGLLLLNVRANLSLSSVNLTDNFVNCFVKYEHISEPECFNNFEVNAANTSIYLLDSTIAYGNSCFDSPRCDATTSGLTLVFNQILYGVDVHVSNVLLQDNAGGGNIMLYSTSCSLTRLINFTNVTSMFSSLSKFTKQSSYGLRYNEIQCSCKAPVLHRILISQSLFNRSCLSAKLHDNLGLAAGVTYTTLHLKHTNISHGNCTALELYNISSVILESVEVSNNGGAFSLQVANTLRLQRRYYNITFCGLCIFNNNTGGISIKGDYVRLLHSTHLRFAEKSTTVISNNAVLDQIGKQYGATMYISDAVLEFEEASHTKFVNNSALLSGGITAIRSQMWFLTNLSLEFIGNTGHYGGGIGMYEKSELIFYNSSATIEFRNNSALNYGGGLYVDDSSYLERISNQYIATYFSLYCCFPSLNFYYNTAHLGGSSVYGGWIDWVNNRSMFLVPHSISQFIHITPHDGDLSPIASRPTRVCLCSQGKPDCSKSNRTIELFPGDTLNVSVVAIGQKNGTVVSTVVADFCNQSVGVKLKQLERIQIVEQSCTKLQYTPLSSRPSEALKLTVSNRQSLRFADKTIKDLLKNPKYKLQFTDLVIDIKFKACPFGFKLNATAGLCTCQSLSLPSTIDLYCNPNQFHMFRKELTWVGEYSLPANKDNNLSYNSGKVVIFGLCPYGYCDVHEMAVNLTMLDEQCRFNRSGILCGQCQQNLSRVFGSFSCKDCSNTRTIRVVIGYAFCGVALIALLFILNLTISVGTIDSLVFYANIAMANHISSFFPEQFSSSFLYKFISLLNMDSGTESCFYDGMSTYTLSWILFVFPFYIWLLVVIIIAVSHYSSRASRLFGKNAVQVLATLFLLSYAKLLKITISTSAFAFTKIYLMNGTVQHVWLLDGNLPYMSKKHAPLFVATLLLLVFICVPYATTLTFVQWLQRYTHKRILRWMLLLKPFIDAHTGPYKDKHRYWPGFLLFVRAGTFYLFALNSRTNQRVNAALVTAITLCLIFYLLFIRGAYKSRILNMIEIAFLLNLCVLSMSSFFQEIFNKPDLHLSLYVAYVSVGSAFVYTCLVIIYHTAVRFNTTPLGSWMRETILPIICSTVKGKFSYVKLIGSLVSDDEYESSASEVRSPQSSNHGVTHSSLVLRVDEPLLLGSY